MTGLVTDLTVGLLAVLAGRGVLVVLVGFLVVDLAVVDF